jgi:hypothetical protein
MPYNLLSLRTNLETVQKEADAAGWTRQLQLEESALDTTIERLKHEMEKLEALELGGTSYEKAYNSHVVDTESVRI